jgi:hypothetical protein
MHMRDDAWSHRRPGAGLLLLLVVLGAMAWPLWHWRNNDHPLAGSARVDLCALLRGAPSLSGLQLLGSNPSDAAGACEARGSDGQILFQAMLYTNRNLAQASDPPQRIDRYFDNARNQIRSSLYVDGFTELGKPGARAFRYAMRPRDVTRREWMVEDHGVLLSIRSTALDAGAFDRLAEPLRLQLRAPAETTPAISMSSPAAANQATSPGAHAQP